jgi:hypothetical protein
LPCLVESIEKLAIHDSIDTIFVFSEPWRHPSIGTLSRKCSLSPRDVGYIARKMLDYHVEDLMTCVRERIKKDEAITQTKLAHVCKMDPGTVKNHFQSIVNRDLGDGTKILIRKICDTEYYRDPPEEQDRTFPVVGIVVTGIILSAAVIFALRSSGSQGQVRRWVPVLSPSAFVPVFSRWTYSSTV